MAKLARLASGVAVGIALITFLLLAPSLWYMIPWRQRWWVGELLYVGLVAGCFVLAFRKLPRAAWPLIDPSSRPHPGWDRAVAVGLWAIGLSMAVPLLRRGDEWGGLGDWDLHLQWYEALRKTVLEYGQFPWWNPWNCGGWLLAAEPQFGLVSVDTPLVLGFGTKTGLKLALVADLLIAMEGARRLARLWFRSPVSVAAASAIYAWNGAIIIAGVGNRALPMSYPFLPWLLLYAFQVERGVGKAVGLGIALALNVMGVIQYPTFYGMLITAIVLIWGFWTQPDRPARVRYLRHLWLALGVFLALAGWRLAISGLIFADFPRKMFSSIDFTIRNYWDALTHRSIPPTEIYRSTYTMSPDWFPELASYVGWAAMAATALSLRRGWRWWHTLAAVCFLFAWGGMHLHHPSYWMSSWPIFSSMHVVSRWRMPAMLGLAFAAASGLDRRQGEPRWLGALSLAVGLGIVADLATYAHQCLPAAFSIPASEVHFPEGSSTTIENIAAWEYHGNTQAYECLTKGLGVIQGYCPQLGYYRGRPTRRLWREAPGYLGEAWSEGKPIAPAFWSPNRIVFEARPGQSITINQNPGSWWWINGRQGFPKLRCAELNEDLVAQADEHGRLVLEIRPRGLRLAGVLTALGLVVCVVALFLHRRDQPRI